MIAYFLKEFFDPYFNLNLKVWENFGALGEIKEYPKDTILKEANKTEKHLNIIISGCGGNLIWNKNNFICIDLAFEKQFLNDYMSFAQQRPTPIEVKLFEDTKIFRISNTKFQQVFNEGNYGNIITKIISETSFFHKQQQQIDLLTKTAKERYIELLKTQNKIEKIPLKYLASYLGVTPQSLSRLRSQKI